MSVASNSMVTVLHQTAHKNLHLLRACFDAVISVTNSKNLG
jgi:hypothetical protein